MRANNCPPIEARFYAKTQRIESGCLVWTGALSARATGDYGTFTWHGRKTVLAHRVAWMLNVGEIPDGYQIDHLCKNTRCVEVSHLDAVPPHVNNERSTSPSALNARKVACPQGHEYDAENTYIDPKGTRHCRACQRERDHRRRKVGAK